MNPLPPNSDPAHPAPPSSGAEHPNDDDLLAAAIPIPEDEAEPASDLDSRPMSDESVELAPIDLVGDDDHIQGAKIQRFEERKPHDEHWTRTPNITGKGAIHVKTFVSKLRLDAIEHLDEQVNSWLDNHPEYEVKFVTTSVGKLIGKIPEQAIFMNVWV